MNERIKHLMELATAGMTHEEKEEMLKRLIRLRLVLARARAEKENVQ